MGRDDCKKCPLLQRKGANRRMLVIGDVHGKTDEYHQILKNNPHTPSVQLGDFGFEKQHQWFLDNVDCRQHRVLFGNHDYYPLLKESHSLGDFGAVGRYFWIRGASSIDRDMRTIGIDWFPEEEMSINQLQECVSAYLAMKPKIVLSHDCPHSVCARMFEIEQISRTRSAMDEMLEKHAPQMWIFGHHHVSKGETINGTRFVCLQELDYIYVGDY